MTEIIPQNVVMLAMGGRSSADIKVKIVYTGVDTQGNSIAAEIEIPVEITRSTSAETFAGKGSLLLPVFDTEVPIDFKGVSITNVNGKTKLKSGSVLQDTNIIIERGTIKLEITGLLLTADGVWIDGKISVQPSIMTPGIGPLFMYAVALKENGLNSKVLLKEPQKGRQGDYEVSVNQFEFKMGRTSANLTIRGVMTKPAEAAWKIPLKLTISFGEEK